MNGFRAPTDLAPQLDLSFRHHIVRGTWLDRRMFRWPYTISRGFRLDTGARDTLTLILQTVSGAIHGDDRLSQRIHVGPNAAAHIMTQGATSVYRARAGTSSTDDILLDLEQNGSIEYTPELRILFPGSSLTQRIRVQLPESAIAVVTDGFVVHDPDGANGPFRHYSSELALHGFDGSLLALDRFALDTVPSSRGRRTRYVAYGTLVVAARQSRSSLETLCSEGEARMAAISGIYAAASILPNDAGVTFRLAAISGHHLRLGLLAARGDNRRPLFHHNGSAPCTLRTNRPDDCNALFKHESSG
jgi:urease accessory protein